MKRKDLLRELARVAAKKGLDITHREGASHTIVTIGGQAIAVPRHREINEITARKIIRTAEEA